MVTDTYPVSFDAHVTFEARESIFTLNIRGEKTGWIDEKIITKRLL